jgi:hypothetical protein
MGQRDLAGLSLGIVVSSSRIDGTNRPRRMSYRWALVVSNHRPPPCKGEAHVQVRGLSSLNRVPSSAVESL